MSVNQTASALPLLTNPASAPDRFPQAAESMAAEARSLMAAGRVLCAPAVLGVLNQRLGGGMSREMVERLTAALPQGMHNSGSICGALSGGMLALGLFLGQGREVEKAARALHRQFEASHGSTNCLTLTRQAGGRRARRQLCLELTGLAAGLAARLILERRPDLYPALASSPESAPGRPHWWRRLRQA